MGTKSIWDGVDLPEKGDEVLIHLASLDEWVRHRVSGYRIKTPCSGHKRSYLIFIQVDASDDRRSSKNERSLHEIRPLHWSSVAEVTT